MGKKGIIVFILVAICSFAIIAVVLYLKQFTPKYDWDTMYDSFSTEPYGTSQIKSLINQSNGTKNFIELNKPIDEIKNNSSKKFTYISIGYFQYYDSLTAQKFIELVRDGNTVFLSSVNLSLNLCEQIDSTFIIDTITTYFIEKKTTADLTCNPEKKYIFNYRYLKKDKDIQWSYFNETFFNSNLEIEKLGYVNDGPNFVCIKIGKGKLFLHLAPIFFTNYHISKTTGFEYAQLVLKNLEGNVIIWDEYYRENHFDDIEEKKTDSPLKFILSQKSFEWAYFLGLVLILLFLLFHTKREQKIIPLVVPLKNTSIEYAKTIGRFNFGKIKNRTLSIELINLFDDFTHKRYSIPRNSPEEERIRLLVRRSNIPEKHIKAIFSTSALARNWHDDDTEYVVKLYELLDYFYKNCK